MTRQSYARTLAAVYLSIATCAAVGAEVLPAQSDHVFVERFDGAGNGRWTLASTNPTSPGVRFHTAEEKPGFHFISQGVSSATAPWDLGNGVVSIGKPSTGILYPAVLALSLVPELLGT